MHDGTFTSRILHSWKWPFLAHGRVQQSENASIRTMQGTATGLHYARRHPTARRLLLMLARPKPPTHNESLLVIVAAPDNSQKPKSSNTCACCPPHSHAVSYNAHTTLPVYSFNAPLPRMLFAKSKDNRSSKLDRQSQSCELAWMTEEMDFRASGCGTPSSSR